MQNAIGPSSNHRTLHTANTEECEIYFYLLN